MKSNLCYYADAYILVNGRITIAGAGADGAARRADERDKGVTFKNWAPFTKCINRINNTEIDNAKDIDIGMPMYNLIEYSDNYSKPSGSLWQYYKNDPDDNMADSESFKYKVKITGKTLDDRNTKNVEIIAPLKDDYTTGFLLDYSYFKENYKQIAIDLSKQQALDADPRAIQQINFTANLDRDEGATIFYY